MSRYRLEIWFDEYDHADRILKALHRDADPNIYKIAWGREMQGIVILHDVFDTHIVELQKQIEKKALELGIWNEESLHNRGKADRKEPGSHKAIRESRAPLPRPDGDG